MSTAVINDKMTVTYPKGFHVMDEAERKKVFPVADENRWAIWDTQRHIIIAIQWHKAPALLSKIVDTKSLAKRIEDKARKSYRNNGYQGGELFERTIGGEQAWGVSFEYEISGTKQVAEAYVLKHDGYTYSIYYYAAKDRATASKRILVGVLDSLAFG